MLTKANKKLDKKSSNLKSLVKSSIEQDLESRFNGKPSKKATPLKKKIITSAKDIEFKAESFMNEQFPQERPNLEIENNNEETNFVISEKAGDFYKKTKDIQSKPFLDNDSVESEILNSNKYNRQESSMFKNIESINQVNKFNTENLEQNKGLNTHLAESADDKVLDFKLFKFNSIISRISEVLRYKSVLLIFLVIIFSLSSLYLYSKKYNNSDLNPLEKITRLTIIPLDETPEIYKIPEGADVLKNPLFKKAISGDTVFVFQKNKQIYVYRETDNKIVNIIQISDTPLAK